MTGRGTRENWIVLTLLLFVVLIWLVIAGFLAAWTLWFQSYIYSEPVGQIYWRAPVAGTALGLFVALMVTLDYNNPGRYGGVFDFSASQNQEQFKEMYAVNQSWQEEKYVLKTESNGQKRYLRESDGKEMPNRPLAVIVVEDNKRVLFAPEVKEGKYELVESGGRSRVEYKGKDGKSGAPVFKVSPDGLRYIDAASKREMLEGQFGRISTFRWWWLFQNLFLNFFHFLLWWACLWLLLKYQFWHAFGLGLVMWLAMTIFVLPPLLEKTERVAHERTAAKTADAK